MSNYPIIIRDLVEEAFSEDWSPERSSEALVHIKRCYDKGREDMREEIIKYFQETGDKLGMDIADEIRNLEKSRE